MPLAPGGCLWGVRPSLACMWMPMHGGCPVSDQQKGLFLQDRVIFVLFRQLPECESVCLFVVCELRQHLASRQRDDLVRKAALLLHWLLLLGEEVKKD